MLKNTFQAAIASAFLLSTTFISCKKEITNDSESQNSISFSSKGRVDETVFYAISSENKIDKFSTSNPTDAMSSVMLTGLMTGERIMAMDFRPATGQLYGISSTGRLYVINPESGNARMVGAGPVATLNGRVAAFDFNPTVDRIRLITGSGQNFRLNPETGTVAAVDGNINGSEGASISGGAYTNNMAGASSTTLYDIDNTTGKLFKQIPPNNGTLVEVGSLNLKITGEGGFDISPDGIALAIYEVNKKSTLFSVDLNTGTARTLAKFEKGVMYYSIAIPTNPVAYAASTNNALLIFNPTMPSTTLSKNITGTQSGENILGIDFRPFNGQLYALGSNSRIYTINLASGAATFVATLSTPLEGTSFGFDFNPVPDRIRIISNTGQNLRVNPETGAAIVDGSLNPGSPNVNAAAYTNNFAGTTSTMLFVIDSNTDMLYLQSPPNNGTLSAIGNLGVNVTEANGFDIGGMSNKAWALLTSDGQTRLYSINTSNGSASAMGNFNSTVNGFAVGLGF